MTLLYPGFLFALGAIAIPVIIHLVQLRKPKKLLFSNVIFLREAKNITASSRKLKNLLVLLCRIAAIIFLVLAFAQPFIPAANSGAVATDNVNVYIDNSLSMQQQAEGEDLSLLDMAVDQAKNLVGLFPASTAFTFSDNGQYAGAGAIRNGEKLTEDLNNLNYSARPATVDNILARISRGGTGAKAATASSFIFSDFQKNSFNPAVFKTLDTVQQYYLVPLKAQEERNVRVDSVTLEDEFIRLQDNNKLLVRIRNMSSERIEGCDVKLFINDNQVSAISLDLEPEQAHTITFNFQVTQGGTHYGRIEISDAPVEFDNNYFFTLQPAEQIKIYHVTADASSAIRKLYVNEPSFYFNSDMLSTIDYRKLQQADLVLVEAGQELEPGLADNLKKYVQEGGTLVFIPGAGAGTASYTNFFQSLGLPPVRIVSTGAEKAALSPPDQENPFFRTIFSEFDQKMLMPQATPMLTWSRSGNTILKFRQGNPFLASFRSGQGNAYLFASPLTPPFTDFTSHALMVPVMYKLAIGSYKQVQEPAYTFGNRNIAIETGNADLRKGIFKLVKDSLEYIPEQVMRSGKLLLTPPAQMAEAGYYKLQRADSTYAVLAFNYDKSESDLSSYSADELKQLIGKNRKNVHIYESNNAGAVKAQFEKENFGVPLWKYCLILCLIFLLLEIILIRIL